MTWRDRVPAWPGGQQSRKAVFLIGLVLGGALAGGVVAAAVSLLDPVSQSGTVSYDAADGPNVTVSDSLNISGSQVFEDNETIDLDTSKGNVSFSSAGKTNVTVDQFTGAWTNVSGLNVTGANLTVNPEDKQQVVVGGDADSLQFKSMAVGDGETDFVYSGSGGTTTLKLYGLPADTYIGLYDPSAGDILAGGQTTSNGVLVVETPNSEHTVELVGTEGDPEFDGESASPVGEQSTDPDQLAINVTDPDFPEDTVNVSFYLNGEYVGSDTLEDAGRATVTLDDDVADGDWYAVAEDEYGQTTQSVTYEFAGPDKIYFYNESSPGELLDNTTISATIYQGENVYNRTTTNGTFNLSNLPANKELVLVAEADGFYNRHIVIESLAEQQEVYMLPKENVSAVEVRFKIEDKTGDFNADTTDILIKKPITKNNTTTYRVVAADEAGVQGFTTYLEEDVRYRIVVRNDDGDQRVLGAYTASVSETVTLTIGQLGFGANAGEKAYNWEASYENESGAQVTFSYSDPQNVTKNINVLIYERGNESNVIHDGHYDGPFGSLSVTQMVPDASSDATWVVEWSASRNNEKIQGKRVVGPDEGEFGMELDPMWKSVAAVGLVIVAGGFFGGVQASLGAGVIAVLGGFFWWIRWLPSEIGAGAVVLALAIAAFTATQGRGV